MIDLLIQGPRGDAPPRRGEIVFDGVPGSIALRETKRGSFVWCSWRWVRARGPYSPKVRQGRARGRMGAILEAAWSVGLSGAKADFAMRGTPRGETP